MGPGTATSLRTIPSGHCLPGPLLHAPPPPPRSSCWAKADREPAVLSQAERTPALRPELPMRTAWGPFKGRQAHRPHKHQYFSELSQVTLQCCQVSPCTWEVEPYTGKGFCLMPMQPLSPGVLVPCSPLVCLAGQVHCFKLSCLREDVPDCPTPGAFNRRPHPPSA